MDTQTSYVIEATEVNFQTAVVAKSMETPFSKAFHRVHLNVHPDGGA